MPRTRSIPKKKQSFADQQLMFQDLERCTSDIRNLLQEIEKMKLKNRQLQNENSRLQLIHLDYKSIVSSLQSSDSNLVRQNHLLTNALDHSKYLNEDKEKTISVLMRENENLQQRVIELEEHHKTHEETRKNNEDTINELKLKLEQTTKEHQSLIAQFEQYVSFVFDPEKASEIKDKKTPKKPSTAKLVKQ